MNQNTPRKYWPYDEVQISRDLALSNRFIFDSPWLTHQFSVDESVQDRINEIVQKLATAQASASDIDDISWLLETVKTLPFAYILPRSQIEADDTHEVIDIPRIHDSPDKMLLSLLTETDSKEDLNTITEELKKINWTWDTDAVQDFSKCKDGFDPESVFSVVRRFHLLNDIENNKTQDLLNYLSTLDKNSDAFKFCNAVVIRQNHHITKICEQVISAGLNTAQSSKSAVLEFIEAESGHDKILEVALKAMGRTPADIPVLSCVTVLMELFQAIAEKNFLAFSMVVDVFERSSYLNEDPLATVLSQGGEEKAAYQLNAHRDINEKGGHENVAIGFLQNMRAVDQDYLIEAVKMAELLTLVIHMVSKDSLEFIRK